MARVKVNLMDEAKAQFELGFPPKEIAKDLNLLPETVVRWAVTYGWRAPRRAVANGRAYRPLAPAEIRIAPTFTKEEAFALGFVEADFLRAATKLGFAAEARTAWDKVLMVVGFDG